MFGTGTSVVDSRKKNLLLAVIFRGQDKSLICMISNLKYFITRIPVKCSFVLCMRADIKVVLGVLV
jgi:hypothetical protein